MPFCPSVRLVLAAAVVVSVTAPTVAEVAPPQVEFIGVPVLEGSNITFNFNPSYVFDGEGKQQYNGHNYVDFRPSVSVDTGFLNLPPIPVGIAPSSRDGQPHFWSAGHNWNNPLVWIGNGAELGVSAGADLAKGVVKPSAVIDTVDTFVNMGPTEQTLNVVPVLFDFTKTNVLNRGALPDDVVNISLGGGVKLRYDVTINTGTHIVRNQNATVEDFAVQSGALMTRSGTFFDPNDIFSAPTQVTGGTPTFHVKGDFTNHGSITDLNGTFDRNFTNTGFASFTGTLKVVGT